MKVDIRSYVLRTSSFLCDTAEPRYRQKNVGYQIIKIVKYRSIPYSENMIPCVVLPVFPLLNIVENTACTQMKGDIRRYVLSTSNPMCDIGEPRYRLNNKGYQILRIGY